MTKTNILIYGYKFAGSKQTFCVIFTELYKNVVLFLSRFIDTHSKYVWLVGWIDKKSIKIANASQKILCETDLCAAKLKGYNPRKICVGKDSKFCSRQIKSWLQYNDIKMYSTHIEGKSVAAEGFCRILESIVYKYMTSLQKIVKIDKSHDTFGKYNDTY